MRLKTVHKGSPLLMALFFNFLLTYPAAHAADMKESSSIYNKYCKDSLKTVILPHWMEEKPAEGPIYQMAEVLSLNCEDLESLPEAIGLFVNLKALSLQGNPHLYLTSWLQDLLKLEKVSYLEGDAEYILTKKQLKDKFAGLDELSAATLFDLPLAGASESLEKKKVSPERSSPSMVIPPKSRLLDMPKLEGLREESSKQVETYSPFLSSLKGGIGDINDGIGEMNFEDLFESDTPWSEEPNSRSQSLEVT